MPQVNGIELLQLVKQDDKFRAVPVISEWGKVPHTCSCAVRTCLHRALSRRWELAVQRGRRLLELPADMHWVVPRA